MGFDLNNVTKGKAIPLGVIIIIITFLISGSTTSLTPFLFFTGILIGIMKKDNVVESALSSLLSSFIGVVIATAIELIVIYYVYGQVYVTYMLNSSLIYILFYVIVGIIGGIVGYYIAQEIYNKNPK